MRTFDLKTFLFFLVLSCFVSVAFAGQRWEPGNSIDTSTNAHLTIDYGHHEIHDGSAFHFSYANAVTNTNEKTCIAFNTPNTTKRIHMVWNATATAVATFSVYSAPSVDPDEGTNTAVQNRNQSSTGTSVLTSIETAPTANEMTTFDETTAAAANITTTTEIYHEVIGVSGSPVSTQGGASRDKSEWILAQNTQYAVCLNADDANDNQHNIVLDWYESTPKD